MHAEEVLDELEAQIYGLEPWETKNDPEPAYKAIVGWIASLPSKEREQVFENLPKWLQERVHPWHAVAAVEIGARLSERTLLAFAADEARRRGVVDEDVSVPVSDWFSFHLALISALTRTPVEEGISHLRELRKHALRARGSALREVSIRAWIAL